MKKVKVTIREFIENGGILEEGREIFTTLEKLFGYYLNWDDRLCTHYVSNASHKSMPIPDIFMVEIETKPIYK